MNKLKSTFSFLGACLFVLICTTATQAAAQRTFVAGPGIGNDANVSADCSFSMPCRNFSAAFGVTNVGGEIIALSPGVGYGGLTINKAITITGLPGQVTFVAVTAGATGFFVNAGASDLVVVRNVSFNGSNTAGSTGITHTSGRLVVKNCLFQQLTTGLNVTNAKMDLIESDFHNNTTAVNVTGSGTGQPGAGSEIASVAQVRINGGNITFNTNGLVQNSPGFNAVANNLFNIWVFTFGSSGSVNLAGNTTSYSCTGPNSGSPSFNPCQGQPGLYNMTTQLK